MRNFGRALIAGAGLCAALVTGASAADIRPAYKAPVYAPPPPVWSWTGFYIGAQVGGGWGLNEWRQNINLGVIAPILPLIFSEGSHPTSGAFGGGVVGFNFQAGWIVFGVEADFNGSDIKGRSNCGLLAVWNCNSKIDSFGTITGRIGAVADKALIYVKAGGAWAHSEYDLNLLGLNIAVPGVLTIQPSRIEDTRWGWVVGTGVEYALPGNWSAKIEYNYMDFGSKNYQFNTIVIPALPALANILNNFDITERVHTVKFGVNYRFGGRGALYAAY